MNPHLKGIDTVILRVKNIGHASLWYVQKLGLTVEYEDPLLKLVVLNTGGPTSLTLWETQTAVAENSEGSPYPIFRTPDANAARNALVAQSVKSDSIITDHAVTYFRFYDPDGNMMEACQVHP